MIKKRQIPKWEYYKECDICKKEFTGRSKQEADKNLRHHIMYKHKEVK